MSHKIVFEPFGIVTNIEEQENILLAAQRLGLKLDAYCNGQQVCGKCKIRIAEGEFPGYGSIRSERGNVTEMSKHERSLLSASEVQAGYRLACMTKVKKDVVVEIPRESLVGQQVILEKGKERNITLHPSIQVYTITVSKPTLQDNLDDYSRIEKQLLEQYEELDKNIEIDYEALRSLSISMREESYVVSVYVWMKKRILKIVPGVHNKAYGIAVDVGTTTIAAYLCDLTTGKQLQSASLMNPQIKYGDDVLTRISYCTGKPEKRRELHNLLFDGLNQVIGEMAKKEDIQRTEILECVLVFNTVMEHIALDIAPDYIGQAPFVSTIKEAQDLYAKDLGLDILPNANVHCLPVEAGFIGADNVAVLIAEEPYKQEKMQLIIDIGTNTEICLGNKGKLFVTSCATGPALEGAQISCGMRAAEGAIEKISIDPITLEPTYRTIKNVLHPIGICGSGIIDAVAQMAFTGIIDPDGKFSKHAVSKRIRTDRVGKKEYVLYFAEKPNERDIVITQKDVRAVQLAKAALYAGAKALMKRSGIENVDEVVLAGGFGSYINKDNALQLGMFPDCNLEHVTVSGNAAGIGAKLALLNIDKRKEAIQVAKNVEFVETATDLEFQQMFADAMSIPPDKDNFSANLTGNWACQGQDGRRLPKEVLTLGMDAMRDVELLEQSMGFIMERDVNRVHNLPLMQNIEAVALGATPRIISAVYAIKDYKYNDIEEIHIEKGQLLQATEIQTLLTYIDRHSGEPFILDVEGPFSVLSGLVNPTALFLAGRKKKEQLRNLLQIIVEELADYVIEAVRRGVQVISLAEPEGPIELVGKKFYMEYCGPMLYEFLKKIEPELKHTVVQICGKTSYAMERSGFVLTKRMRVEEKKYLDILLELSKDKKTKFVGHACINRTNLPVPIVTRLELVE